MSRLLHDPVPRPSRDRPHRPHRAVRSRRSLLMLVLLVLGCLGLLLSAAGIGVGLWLQHGYNRNIQRFTSPFTALPPASRPSVVARARGAQNILLLGSDSLISAGDPKDWIRGAQRTDAIMIAHIPSDRKSLSVVSIPRDSYVNIPGYGMNKINAGFSFGGPTLAVKTIENYTGVRIDHVAIVDFDGFSKITDDLGGVEVTIPKATHWRDQNFSAGTQTLNGARALLYVRQRHDLPGGDFDREKRQQNWMRAIALKTEQQSILKNPLRLNAVLQSLTRSIEVDSGFSIGDMRSLALSIRHVPATEVSFLTAPVAGTPRIGSQDVVLLDRAANKALWQAMADDELPAWLAAHPSSSLGSTVH